MFVATRDIGLVISTGEDVKMYTARLFQEGIRHYDGVPFHVKETTYLQNLSTNLETAKEKAAKMAALMGLELLTGMSTDRSLFEIERSTPEVVARRIREKAEKEAADDLSRRQAKHDHIIEVSQKHLDEIHANVFFMGKHAGRSIQEVAEYDPTYIQYLLDNVPSLEDQDHMYSHMIQLQTDMVRRLNLELVIKTSNHVGELKSKVSVDVTCIRKTGFANDYGWVDRYTCVDAEGNVFLVDYTGCAWEMEEFGKYRLTGTVKAHGEYQDVKQTKLTRSKVITAAQHEIDLAATKKVAQPSKKPGASKKDRAIEIYSQNKETASRQEIIKMFMEQLDMSKAGASTYYAQAKKYVG